MSLKNRTISGVKWQIINKGVDRILSIGTVAILARILEPSVFGLFAMAFIVISALDMFKTLGVDSALIQKKDADDETVHTAFILVQSLGILIFLICQLIAPVAGVFLNNAEVVSVVRALGVIFLLSCFAKIPTTILTKQLRFDLISIISLVGGVVNSIAAVCLTMLWANVWSLVFAYLAKQTVISLLSRHFSGYRFKPVFSAAKAKELLKFGKYMVGTSLFNIYAYNLDNIVISRVMNVTFLGFYTLAFNIANMVNIYFTNLVTSVLFPAFATIQNDKSELKRIYLRITTFIGMFTMPCALGVALVAPELVLTIYGEKWASIVPLVQLFAMNQVIIPLLSSSGAVFMACGKPGHNLKIYVISTFIRTPLVIFFTLKWGLAGAIWSSLVVTTVAAPFSFGLIRRMISVGYAEFLRVLIPAMIATSGMSLIVVGVRMFLSSPSGSFVPDHAVIRLFLLSFIGVISYAVILFFVDRSNFIEAKSLILKPRSGRKAGP